MNIEGKVDINWGVIVYNALDCFAMKANGIPLLITDKGRLKSIIKGIEGRPL